jgi:demethylmenaquinone methyltransferase/2-methoxy-6-polyprenyl-1,4-benzoquinol methylase
MGSREFFNEQADTWDEINQYPMEKIESMLDMLNITPGDTVLDVGTGTGILLPLLMQRTEARNITAIDAADKMIEKAKNKLAGTAAMTAIHFIAADVLEYPFPDGTFNHIICYSVFPHFENKRAAIEKLSAALKPGGLLSVLHSASRERINGTHTHIRSHSINSDYLLPAREYVPLLNRNGLTEEYVIDSEEMFMLCGRKQKT